MLFFYLFIVDYLLIEVEISFFMLHALVSYSVYTCLLVSGSDKHYPRSLVNTVQEREMPGKTPNIAVRNKPAIHCRALNIYVWTKTLL